MISVASKDDRISPFWRFLLAVVVIFGTTTLTGAIVGTCFMMAGVHPGFEVAVFFEACLFILAICGVFKLMLAAFDNRPLASMGLGVFPHWGMELIQGVGIGGAMILAVAVAEWALGDAHFGFQPHSFLLGGLFVVAMFAAAAAKEEIIFRGYAFQRLAEAATPAGAVVLMSVLFGLAHLLNPHHTWISTLNTALVGVTLSLAYLRTRALWMPIGVHFAWNFLQGFFLGLPVSGLIITNGMLSAHVMGSQLITGGAYGPEGGLPATIVILVATTWLGFAKKIRPAPEMEALISGQVNAPKAHESITLLAIQNDKNTLGDTP